MPAGAFFHSISMASADEGWAVGTAGPGTTDGTFAEHYLHGQWSRVDPLEADGPNAGQVILGSLNQVQAVAKGDAWAVGESDPSSGPGLILHWANGRWTHVDLGIPLNILHSIDMISPTEGWVVGDGQEILHLRNGTWTKEGTTLHGFETDQVAMTSASEGWAIGGPLSGDGPGPAVLHYHDGVWTSMPLATILTQAQSG
jgi:hypothetical protein